MIFSFIFKTSFITIAIGTIKRNGPEISRKNNSCDDYDSNYDDEFDENNEDFFPSPHSTTQSNFEQRVLATEHILSFVMKLSKSVKVIINYLFFLNFQ